MSESITISKKTPASKSMDYDFLRQEGIKYIQRLAGRIWTDYNIHDPGVTTLEVLCYAITELGYRAGYPVEDLLATDPADKNAKDILNFHTARQILPNAPVTVNDYRKLLIDVDVTSSDPGCLHAGVKNAWIEQSKTGEIPFYLHRSESRLAYDPDPLYVLKPGETSQPPVNPGILFDILLEFDKCDAYGDLNENTITKTLLITEHTADTNLNGLEIKITVEFPRWDNEETDWNDTTSIKAGVIGIQLQFVNVPNGYGFQYELINNVVKLKGSITSASDVVDIPGIKEIETKVNDFIYYDAGSLLNFYRQKVNKIGEIIDKVKARLHANRNLCEDVYMLRALKVEKIAVCADIELANEADVNEVQAEIYHEIAKFLSPTVHFYTLDEMLDKCRVENAFEILETDTKNKSFTVKGDTQEKLRSGDTLSVRNSRSNDGDYTAVSVTTDNDTGRTRIFVKENITSDLLTEGETLVFITVDQSSCLTAAEIFEGPPLEHGFIDDEELEKADRRKYIHVSDLIQIIMDIPGVTAVRSIQIANIPQDNEDGAIPSKSVKWCMDLAFEQNYVPRLTKADSKLTFYKDDLPFRASSAETDAIIKQLEAGERPAKLFDPVLDFEVPQGIYRDLASYESIQNDFPLTYGIGEEGIPTRGSDDAANTLREAQARQFKGFLMIFDQLLADYFAQLAHVKDLFSMNAEKDEKGNYVIGRTYYTQPLFDIVPGAGKLYVDKNGHAVALDNIAESEDLFLARKNRFLDHLIGRFAERFTDYALLTIKLSGEQTGRSELIEDKLAFLNRYPLISSARGKGFNHQDGCRIWHPDNISGLRRRASFLTGIEETGTDHLYFGSRFALAAEGAEYRITVSNSASNVLLKSGELLESEEEAKAALENMIVYGCRKENYTILSDDGSNYYFKLECGGDAAVSGKTNYPDDLPGGAADTDIDTLVEIFRKEFFGNTEANRNNLACPLLNYLDYSITVNMATDPPEALVSFGMYFHPLSFNPADKILTGQYKVTGSAKSQVDIITVDTVAKKIVIDGNIAAKLNSGSIVVITGSQANDGSYTVVSAADSGGNTEIIVNEPIPSAATPLGELNYNNESESELRQKAENKLDDIFWELIVNASGEDNYYFSDDSGNYRFRITGNAGQDMAESTESDFNEPLADELGNLPSGKITISGSAGNDGEYTVTAATAQNDEVNITVDRTLPSAVADGTVNIREEFDYSVDEPANAFRVGFDLRNILFSGDTITVSGSDSVDGDYTVYAVDYNGTETVLTVEETIPAADTKGKLSYGKSFAISAVSGSTVTIKGGYEHKTVAAFTEFIKSKFFSHEGFHVVEHILLRPKVRGLHFVDATAETLTEGLANNGSLYFNKTLPLFSASNATNTFRVEGNLTGLLDGDETTDISSEIYISGTGANDGYYAVKSVSYNGTQNRTHIRTQEKVPADIPAAAAVGELSFLKGTPVTAVSSSGISVTVTDPETLQIFPGETVEIRGSADGANDGRYLVKEVNDAGTQQQVIFSRVETEIEDKLLDIVLDDEDCDSCRISDPYTCVVSVILPHWQGRFGNSDFRRFFERQIRLETPAHVFLNICWISCSQMNAFELKYKRWLLENSATEKDRGRLSAAQNELVEIMNKLRNVYPSGTLHDCTEDETLENAIILDNTALGNT